MKPGVVKPGGAVLPCPVSGGWRRVARRVIGWIVVVGWIVGAWYALTWLCQDVPT